MMCKVSVVCKDVNAGNGKIEEDRVNILMGRQEIRTRGEFK